MSTENRDWYRDWHRKQQGYTERGDFRISEATRQKRQTRRAWRRVLVRITWQLGAVALALYLAKSHVLPLFFRYIPS